MSFESKVAFFWTLGSPSFLSGSTRWDGHGAMSGGWRPRPREGPAPASVVGQDLLEGISSCFPTDSPARDQWLIQSVQCGLQHKPDCQMAIAKASPFTSWVLPWLHNDISPEGKSMILWVHSKWAGWRWMGQHWMSLQKITLERSTALKGTWRGKVHSLQTWRVTNMNTFHEGNIIIRWPLTCFCKIKMNFWMP